MIKFIYKYFFYIVLITLIVNLLTIFASYYFGDQNGSIEKYNFSKSLHLLSFISISTISIIFIYQNRNKKPIYWTCLINMFLFLTLVATAEFYFLFTESKKNGLVYLDDREFRLLRPDPYKNSNYFSNEFIYGQYWPAKRPTFFKPSQTNILVPNDFVGKWLNIIHNKRLTTNAPQNHFQNIYVFGGSTLYSVEVPDSLTICSILQRLINNSGKKMKVHNYGVPAATVPQQIERLKKYVEIQFGDIVIFYDGANDISSGVYYGKEFGGIPGFNLPPTWQQNLLIKIKKYSAAGRYFYKKSVKKYQPFLNKSESVSIKYCDNLRGINKYVSEQGGVFFHFLQPHIYTKSSLNLYEQKIIKERDKEAHPNMDFAFKKTMPMIENCLSDFVFSKNLTRCFDELDYSPFIDACHVTELGNKVIAKNIFEVINEF